MTVTTTAVFNDYAGDGTTTAFALLAYCQTAEQVEALVDDVVQSSAGYTVTGLGDAGGVTVTFDTAPADDTVVRVRRVLPLTQETDTVNNETILQDVLDDALDRQVMVDQQLAEEIGRALKTEQGGTEYDAGNGTIVNLADGVASDDAATYGQVLVNRDLLQAGATTASAVLASRAVLALTTVPAALAAVLVLGYAAAGDTVPFAYERVVAEPTHAGKVRSVDRYLPDGSTDASNGGWWALNVAIARPEFFGALTAGSVATATLLAFHDYCHAEKVRGHVGAGPYTVNGPCKTELTIADGSARIFYENTVINVDAGSTAFEILLFFGTTALNSHHITGRLTINANQKCQRGLVLVSNTGGTTLGATCEVEGVSVNDLYAPSGSNGVAYGVQIAGPFETYALRDIIVDGASRHTSLDATGDCKGIRVGELRTNIVLERCVARNILNAVQDADGIAVFGGLSGTTALGKKATLIDCEFEDCQGRSIKTQCQETVVIRPKFKRQNVVTIAQGHEIDSQYGSMLVEHPTFEYRKLAGVSPLGGSFVPLAIQHKTNAQPLASRCIGGLLMTEADMPNFAFFFGGANCPESTVEIDGLEFRPLGSLATTIFTRCLIEFLGSDVEAMTPNLAITVKNTRGPNTGSLIGYNSYGGTSIAAQLRVDAEGNTNTLTPVIATKTFSAMSGTAITVINDYVFGNNPGYSQIMPTAWAVDMSNGGMLPGNDIYVDVATAVFTWGGVAPTSFPASGLARIKTEAQGPSQTVGRHIMVGDCAVANSWFYTQGGTTWGTVV